MQPLRADKSLEQAFTGFLLDYPDYHLTASLDDVRRREFSRLDRSSQIYLDYTGGGLYGEWQLRRHTELLLERTLGNPHSVSPTSVATTELVEEARRHTLAFFGGSPNEYAVIFTANATHALKLVGESYPFGPGDRFLLTYDNHNSVNGIREFNRAHGAETAYVPIDPLTMRVNEVALDRYLGAAVKGRNNLFAFPAQSNFSGIQHPLEWIDRAHGEGWDVLLDAAAFVSTNRLDLSRWRPDYVALSFYKMFGYPTGVGALIARREALSKLRRPWFAGGTITVASVQADTHVPADGSAAFEDGTVDYANIPAVHFGLKFIESIGLDQIHRRVRSLTGWLITNLLALRHTNGRPLIVLYGSPDLEGRGGTITMNFNDSAGELIEHDVIEQLAAKRNISLRTGCFCNPGAGELALGLEKDELVSCFAGNTGSMTLEDFRLCLAGKGTGAVRVSLGVASNFPDVFAFEAFTRSLLDQSVEQLRSKP
ncbi:MAG: aminotransferase class V-fold PLP-dependent enzyme [Thermoanaerobaculia bacterium]